VSREEGGKGLMIDWNDIVKVWMKINYKRYWMRLRISLGSGGSRCGKKKVKRRRELNGEGWMENGGRALHT